VLDGAAATLLVVDAEYPAVSPDGGTIAFTRESERGYRRIMVASVLDTASARALTRPEDGRWSHNEPAWSPDGQWICYAAWDGLWVVAAGGGSARRLTASESDQHPSWSADGRHVYFTSYADRTAALWRVAVATGERERVTVGSGAEVAPDMSRSGRLLAFSSQGGDDNLVMVNLSTGRETEFGTGRSDTFPVFGPDGRAVFFVADRWGGGDIWRQRLADEGRAEGTAERVFEQPGDKTQPAVSPDGRWLAYYRIDDTRPETPTRDVWVVSTSGGTPVRVTSDGNSIQPAWSPDSTTLAFASERGGPWSVWTQRVRDGRPVGPQTRVTTDWPHFAISPAWSPDGSTIAVVTLGPMKRNDVALVSSEGGRPRLVTSDADAVRARWNPRTGALLVSGRWDREAYELRSFRVDDSRAPEGVQPVLLGKERETALFDVSFDGRFVVFPRGLRSGHVWVMESRSTSF
jgi:Tol biopolymer transport system component